MAEAWDIVDISDIEQNKLWVIYGKSNSGKDVTASSFPKPLFYVPIGDDGRNSIKHVKGIQTMRNPIKNLQQLKDVARWAVKDKEYKTVVISTFSLLTSEWQDEKVVKTRKRMTQQLWGDLKVDTEEIIRLFAKAAKRHNIVLICHEALDDQIEGMEGEILPSVRPNVTRGARTYLEGLANYGIHCVKIEKEVEGDNGDSETVIKYGANIGPNPYYWTKIQANPKLNLPATMINPTYKKIQKILNQ